MKKYRVLMTNQESHYDVEDVIKYEIKELLNLDIPIYFSKFYNILCEPYLKEKLNNASDAEDLTKEEIDFLIEKCLYYCEKNEIKKCIWLCDTKKEALNYYFYPYHPIPNKDYNLIEVDIPDNKDILILSELYKEGKLFGLKNFDNLRFKVVDFD